MSKRLCQMCLIAGSAAAVTAASAAPPPPKCHLGSDYLVVTRDRDGETGEDILVRPKPAKDEACRYAVKAGDYVPKMEAGYFVAVAGRYLAVDVGTGPDRQLFAFDVAARRKMLGMPYDDARKVRTTADGFVFWDVGANPVKPASCPKEWRKDPDNALATSPT